MEYRPWNMTIFYLLTGITFCGKVLFCVQREKEDPTANGEGDVTKVKQKVSLLSWVITRVQKTGKVNRNEN